MKQLAKGQLKPQDEIDLHGLTVDEATEKVRFFLQNSIYQGLQVVIVITGKGLHSNNGPVLRRSIEKLLGQLSGQVVEWGVAPRRYGGDGAFVVFLRRPEAK
jgi:DNA-nicking Smr family endonuclease